MYTESKRHFARLVMLETMARNRYCAVYGQNVLFSILSNVEDIWNKLQKKCWTVGRIQCKSNMIIQQHNICNVSMCI